jgi:LysM repeat protein
LASRPSYRNPERPSSPVSLPLLSVSDGGKRTRYTVKKDDTLVRIAERFHTSLAQLRDWNDLSYESLLRPGDTLVVYASPPQGRKETGAAGLPGDREADSGAEWVTHVVRKGETLSSIARFYRVRLADVLAWNQKADRNRLYPGERLKIRRSAG